MAQEFETQVLEVNTKEIIEKLQNLGAASENEVLQKRWVFHIDEDRWIRLRQVGEKATLTYKNKSGTGISETKEIEVEVDDFDKTAELVSRLNFYAGKVYQENKRKRFIFEGIEFTLDTWPMIPTILEIEAESEEKVHTGLALLGLTGKDIGHEGLKKIYKRYDIELHEIEKLTF